MSILRAVDKGPLIPDIAGLTKIVRGELAKSKECGAFLKEIEKQFQEDGRPDATVEDMLTQVRALRAVAGNAEVRGLSAAALDKLDGMICSLIHKVVDTPLPTNATPYHHAASWVDDVRRSNCVEIFTSNYDLLMEQAFEECRVPYFDGFAGVRRPFFDLRAMEEDALPARWARLWKLHGSINWYQVQDKGVFRGTTKEDGASTRVIHPSYLKYQEGRRMPYLAMMDRLRAFLKQPTSALVLCGYSFRDEHINEVIVQALESTPTAMAFALLHGRMARYPQAVALALGRANLAVLARDGAVVSARESTWPEKDAASVSADDGLGVEWAPPATGSDLRRAEFTLGDFSVFGQFLRQLVGSARRSLEVAGAK